MLMSSSPFTSPATSSTGGSAATWPHVSEASRVTHSQPVLRSVTVTKPGARPSRRKSPREFVVPVAVATPVTWTVTPPWSSRPPRRTWPPRPGSGGATRTLLEARASGMATPPGAEAWAEVTLSDASPSPTASKSTLNSTPLPDTGGSGATRVVTNCAVPCVASTGLRATTTPGSLSSAPSRTWLLRGRSRVGSKRRTTSAPNKSATFSTHTSTVTGSPGATSARLGTGRTVAACGPTSRSGVWRQTTRAVSSTPQAVLLRASVVAS